MSLLSRIKKQGFSYYLKEYFKLNKWVFIGIIIAILLDVLLLYIFPQLLNRGAKNFTTAAVIGLIIFFLAFFVFPSVLIITFIVNSFNREGNIRKIVSILHSYFGILMIYATLYFSFVIISDYRDQLDKKNYYEKELKIKQTVDHNYEILKARDNRPFKGMKYKLWSGVENPSKEVLELISKEDSASKYYTLYADKFTSHEIDEVPLDMSLKIAQMNIKGADLYKIQREHALNIFVDCIYFSVATIATLGYGDISPNLVYVKFAVISEVICGLVVFVFALNLVFVNWHKEDE